MTTPSEERIRRMIACGESSTVQFKQEFTSQTQMAAEMIAFANSKGGTLLIGVEDKTGEVIGLNYEQIRKVNTELSNAANEHVRPTIYLQTEVVTVDDKNIVAVTIEEGTAKPYKDLNGNIWVKQGADKRRVTENTQMLRLFATSKVYNPDEDGVSGTSMDDLNDRLIDDYLQRVYGKSRTDFEVSYKTLLENMRIINEDGRLTLAGLLYFGKYPQKFKPAFNIKAVAFYGNDLGGTEYRDSKDMEGTIPELFEQAMRFFDMNLRHIQAGQSFNSLGKLEVSQVALEEILQNALVHREYIKQAPIRLLVFDNRVEIISPGCLPDGLTVEQIKMGNTSQRNMLIATFCARTMSYRGLGSGIIRAVNDGTPIDFVNDETGNELKAILWKTEKASSKPQSDQVKASSSEEKASSKPQSDQVKASSSDEKASCKPQSDQVKASSSEEKASSKPQSDQVKASSSEEKASSKAQSNQVKPQSDQVKSQSNDKKSQSNDEKSQSKLQSDQVKTSYKRVKKVSKIISYCSTPRTLKEIMDYIGLTDRVKTKTNYINPLLGKSLKMTQPSSPKSPTQKYVVIDYPL